MVKVKVITKSGIRKKFFLDLFYRDDFISLIYSMEAEGLKKA